MAAKRNASFNDVGLGTWPGVRRKPVVDVSASAYNLQAGMASSRYCK